MYCKKCGFKNEDGAKFCNNCGASLESRVAKKKSKKKIFMIVGIVAVVLVAACVFLINSGEEYEKEEEQKKIEEEQQKQDEKLAQYDSLVEEAEDDIIMYSDYESAFNELKEAIELDPEREQAYIDMIEICIDTEAYDEARAYYNDAISYVGETEALEQKNNKLTAIEVGAAIKDNPFTYYDGHKYEIWAGFETIEEADEFFKLIGGHAASITSKGEDEALYELYQQSQRTSLYFGLAEGSVEGDFRWLTGEQMSYENWADGEPNNGKGIEAVGSYYQKFDGQWNDSLPNNQSYIICEYDN